jgi:hypothetical protein
MSGRSNSTEIERSGMIEIRKTEDGGVRIEITDNRIQCVPDRKGTMIKIIGDWSPEELVINRNVFVSLNEGGDHTTSLQDALDRGETVELPPTSNRGIDVSGFDKSEVDIRGNTCRPSKEG